VLFDAQIMNDHLVSLGAFPVSNQKYLTLLQRALKVKTVWDQCPFVTTDPED
jgi:Leu/Phe-tRNA-protein transferase